MTVERTADDLAAILRRLGAAPADVVGYSLGARIALRLAIAHPDVVRRLVLESPSRRHRGPGGARPNDGPPTTALADRIERDGIAAFVAEWEAQPIFATQAALPPARAARIRAIRLANRPDGLAASLRGAGQGVDGAAARPPRRGSAPRRSSSPAPSTIAPDPRAESVAAGIPGARLAIVDGSGHTPHDERPARFRRLALDFLQEDAA